MSFSVTDNLNIDFVQRVYLLISKLIIVNSSFFLMFKVVTKKKYCEPKI